MEDSTEVDPEVSTLLLNVIEVRLFQLLSRFLLDTKSFSIHRTGPFMAELSPPDWDSMQLPEFQRDFYKEHANVAARTQEEVDEWREKHKVTVRDGEAPKPVLTWGETKLPK